MALSDATLLSFESFQFGLYSLLQASENPTLSSGAAAGTLASRVYDGGGGRPNLGFGFDLTTASFAEIEAAFRYAIGVPTGSVGSRRQQALDILEDWKQGAYTNAQILGMSAGTFGTAQQISAMRRLELTTDEATRLLDYSLFETIGGNPLARNEALSDFLGAAADLPPSIERSVLLDVFYDNPALVTRALRTALANDDRSAVWFALRYNASLFNDLDKDGVRDAGEAALPNAIARRVVESDFFGLLSRDGLGASERLEEAKQTLDFLFNGSFANASVYARIVALDPLITGNAATAGDGFRSEIKGMLDRIEAAYSVGVDLEFVQVDDPGHASQLTGKKATDLGAAGNLTNDAIFGEDGSDTIDGGGGDDLLVGGDGNDDIYGGSGNGNDTLDGGFGADILRGGAGHDRMTGGAGADRFNLSAGNDTITDFRQDVVVFDFEAPAFTGQQSAGNFEGLAFAALGVLTQNAGAYAAALGSGTGVGFVLADQRASIAASSDFAFKGGTFAAVWNDGVTLTLRGYDDGELVVVRSYTLNQGEKVQISLGGAFASIDQVTFQVAGGTDASPSDAGTGPDVAMDDLVFDTPADGGSDRIVLQGRTTVANAIATATEDAAGNAVLHWAQGNLTVLGVGKEEVQADWFI